MTKYLKNRTRYFLAYARRHPCDCLLHSVKRHKLLKDLEGLALKVKAQTTNLGSEAYALQCDCIKVLWDGYFGLKGWYYITNTNKLDMIKRETEEKVARIEFLCANEAQAHM